MNCEMSALYALTDSPEKLFPARALRKMSCPCSSVMSSIVRLLYSLLSPLHIPKTDRIISSDNHLFLHYPLPTPCVNRRAGPRGGSDNSRLSLLTTHIPHPLA